MLGFWVDYVSIGCYKGKVLFFLGVSFILWVLKEK